ncbi:MAG TPA: nuclease-related domain-containing protein [Conexibacter sp.]|nr:nuclease-related domain-containing protein [Conexibacter sp.]
MSTKVISHEAGHFADRRFRARRRAWRRRVWWVLPLAVVPVVAACLGFALLLAPAQLGFFAGLGVGAAAAMVLILIDSPPWHIERWRLGAEGEKRTAKALRPLTRRGWTLVNDIQTERGNIDHILVGPAGVFLLETKNLGGIVSVERGALSVRWREDPDDGYEAPRVGPRARALAAQLAERLRESGMPNVWVQPIVVLWSDFPQGSVQSGGVAWVAGKYLASALAARPTMLSGEQADEMMAVVRSSFGS